jgi:hypothetical protein
MKIPMALAFVLGAAGFAGAQDDVERKMQELRRDHERSMHFVGGRFSYDQSASGCRRQGARRRADLPRFDLRSQPDRPSDEP